MYHYKAGDSTKEELREKERLVEVVAKIATMIPKHIDALLQPNLLSRMEVGAMRMLLHVSDLHGVFTSAQLRAEAYPEAIREATYHFDPIRVPIPAITS